MIRTEVFGLQMRNKILYGSTLTVSGNFEIFKSCLHLNRLVQFYPVSLDFDSNGNIYFVGIRSPSFGLETQQRCQIIHIMALQRSLFLCKASMEFDRDLISTGSITVDNKDEAVWITLLAFGYKGQILKYNIIGQTFDTFDLQVG